VQPRDDDFDAFVASQGSRLLGTAYLLTGDHAAAEDLVQDALERVFLQWHRVEVPLPYTVSALARLSANRWRRRARRPEVPLGQEHDPAVGDGAQQRAQRAEILQALAALPPRQRAVVVLRYLEDLSESETAEALGCSVGTVKSQAHKALATLRSRLHRSDALTLEGT
jgi:RNA polymerase sigma-70 factor (sigma-E family)